MPFFRVSSTHFKFYKVLVYMYNYIQLFTNMTWKFTENLLKQQSIFITQINKKLNYNAMGNNREKQ